MEISMKPPSLPFNRRQISRFEIKRTEPITGFDTFPATRSVFRYNSVQIRSCSVGDLQRCKSNLESLFCYDKSIPEEIIEKPVGISLKRREIGTNPSCIDCQAKGAILCATCSGSGLYVDSIMESQGIIVKVRCLGCGGTGNVMCSECGGRGHVGIK